MPKIRLIAATLLWSAVTAGAASLAFVEVVRGKPDRSAGAATETMSRPYDSGSVWKDDTGALYRRRSDALDKAVSRQPMSVVPTVWLDPPRR